jgi:hypothetical protein
MGSFNLTGNVLSVTTLRLFVPEPGSLLLAAAAVAFGLHSLRRGR